MTASWFLLVGFLLVGIALLERFLDRLTVSAAMIYLLVGFLFGPAVFNVIELPRGTVVRGTPAARA